MALTTFGDGTGGTNGPGIASSPVNANFAKCFLNRKLFSDATERTTTSTSFTDSGTAFTLSAGASAFIESIRFECEVKNSTSNTMHVNLQFSGSTLTTTYVIRGSLRAISSEASNTQVPMVSTSENSCIATDSTSYLLCSVPIPIHLALADADTTIKVRFKTASGTAYVKNVVLSVVYMTDFDENS